MHKSIRVHKLTTFSRKGYKIINCTKFYYTSLREQAMRQLSFTSPCTLCSTFYHAATLFKSIFECLERVFYTVLLTLWQWINVCTQSTYIIEIHYDLQSQAWTNGNTFDTNRGLSFVAAFIKMFSVWGCGRLENGDTRHVFTTRQYFYRKWKGPDIGRCMAYLVQINFTHCYSATPFTKYQSSLHRQ